MGGSSLKNSLRARYFQGSEISPTGNILQQNLFNPTPNGTSKKCRIRRLSDYRVTRSIL